MKCPYSFLVSYIRIITSRRKAPVQRSTYLQKHILFRELPNKLAWWKLKNDKPFALLDKELFTYSVSEKVKAITSESEQINTPSVHKYKSLLSDKISSISF